MADNYVKGGDRIRSYRTTLGVNVSDERLASALRVPIIRLKQERNTWEQRVSETLGENLAAVLGASMANTRTNAGLTVAP